MKSDSSAKSIVTWNIQHREGTILRSGKIVERLVEFDADVVVLTEFRINASGTAIKTRMQAQGYTLRHLVVPERASLVYRQRRRRAELIFCR